MTTKMKNKGGHFAFGFILCLFFFNSLFFSLLYTMLGSNHHSDMKWVSNDDASTTTCDSLQHLPSSPPKKKSMERLSRLFQKKSKHKKSLTDDMPEPPLYQPVSRHSSIHSTQSSYQPPSRINSTSKKGM